MNNPRLKIVVLLLLTCWIGLFKISGLQAEPPKRIVGYFTEWSVYSTRNPYAVSDIPWDKVTHINYAFAKITDGSIALIDSWVALEKTFGDNYPIKGHFGQLAKYKALYPKVKTLISVGGWNHSTYFSDVALTDTGRSIFAESCVTFIRRYGFDGVDLDWEYPAGGGAAGNIRRPEDKSNFTLLLQKIRQKLDAAGTVDGKKYLLTIAAPAGYGTIANTEPYSYHYYLDYINLMSYDYNGFWDTTTNHLAPLYMNPADPSYLVKKTKANVDWTVHEYLRLGVPAAKLNLGIPLYSYGWKEVSGGINGLFGTANGSPPGILNGTSSATGTNPFWYTKNVLEASGSGFIKYYDGNAKVPYLWNPVTRVMYTYDDETSLGSKCDYLIAKGLGGVMFWELSGDYPGTGSRLTDLAYRKFMISTPVPIPATTPVSTPFPKVTPMVTPRPVRNLALKMPVVADSTYKKYYGFKAVDGNKTSETSRWISSNTAGPHWIVVDLGGKRSVTKIRFYTGSFGYNIPIPNYQIQHWNGSSWTVIVRRTGNTLSQVVENFTSPLVASSIRLYSESGIIKLYELEVYGL